jgi:hypothetical protein
VVLVWVFLVVLVLVWFFLSLTAVVGSGSSGEVKCWELGELVSYEWTEPGIVHLKWLLLCYLRDY